MFLDTVETSLVSFTKETSFNTSWQHVTSDNEPSFVIVNLDTRTKC